MYLWLYSSFFSRRHQLNFLTNFKLKRDEGKWRSIPNVQKIVGNFWTEKTKDMLRECSIKVNKKFGFFCVPAPEKKPTKYI